MLQQPQTARETRCGSAHGQEDPCNQRPSRSASGTFLRCTVASLSSGRCVQRTGRQRPDAWYDDGNSDEPIRRPTRRRVVGRRWVGAGPPSLGKPTRPDFSTMARCAADTVAEPVQASRSGSSLFFKTKIGRRREFFSRVRDNGDAGIRPSRDVLFTRQCEPQNLCVAGNGEQRTRFHWKRWGNFRRESRPMAERRSPKWRRRPLGTLRPPPASHRLRVLRR